jgi:hypothetical protein
VKVADLKTGLAYYNFHSFEDYLTAAASGDTLVEDKDTNTTTGSGATRRLRYDYRVVDAIGTLTFNNPFDLNIPITFLGEFAFNTAPKKLNEAWRAGLTLNNKVKGKGDWMITTQYSRLGTDAFPDTYPDSDFDGGGTNAKGWEFIIDYGLAKNVTLGLDYYRTEPIFATGTKTKEDTFQTDVIFKF